MATPVPSPTAEARSWAGEADLIQSRGGRGAGTVAVRLTPVAPVVVRAVHVDAGGGAVTWRGATTLDAGRTVELEVPVPPPVCPAPAAPRATATLEYDVDGGAATATVVLGDPYDALARLALETCTARAVERVAVLRIDRLERAGTGTGQRAAMVLAVDPTGAAGTVLLDRVEPTVLLRPPEDDAAAWSPRVRVTGSDAASELRLPVEPNRCDAHALADDKVGTVFRLAVEVDGEAGEVVLPLADGVKRALLRHVGDRCGLTDGGASPAP